MMSASDIAILVNLLDGWQNLFLKGNQRGMFFIWLSDHAKMEIHAETFKEKLSEWLLGTTDAKALYAEIFTIHAEILWVSHRTKP
ncbi:hypothetical protein ANAEL_00319 [Anaerolineales bacterium]|nr:hypothetical protein ANAEL_00319 [Anaerolineales bacterium]